MVCSCITTWYTWNCCISNILYCDTSPAHIPNYTFCVTSNMGNSMGLKFCGYDCEYAEACADVPSCHTYNPIYCKLKKKIVDKGASCDEKDDRN